jgi:hypothetical protein
MFHKHMRHYNIMCAPAGPDHQDGSLAALPQRPVRRCNTHRCNTQQREIISLDLEQEVYE